jgi:hypothetical protein
LNSCASVVGVRQGQWQAGDAGRHKRQRMSQGARGHAHGGLGVE